MEKTIYDENNGLWYDCGTNCGVTITFPAWQYRLRKKGPSAFGGSDTCGTSKQSAKPCTRN